MLSLVPVMVAISWVRIVLRGWLGQAVGPGWRLVQEKECGTVGNVGVKRGISPFFEFLEELSFALLG